MPSSDPDVEPFAYPPSYKVALRNPTALTIFGAVFLVAGLIFFGTVTTWVVDKVPSQPGGAPLSPAILFAAGLIPLAFIIITWMGLVRLRWQKAYFKRHGVMPLLIGSKQWRLEQDNNKSSGA